ETQPLPLPSKEHGLKLPILMYHHIGNPPPNPGKIRIDLTVSVENFRQQVKWLKDNGYTSVKFSDLYNYSVGKARLPAKPVILSFDDGYQDAFDNAVPALREQGMVGSFAIITQYPATHSGTNFYADWDEIKAAYSQGMEIVSHTQDHFDRQNPKYNEKFISDNLKGSIADIQNHLGLATNVLIYPYGRYTPKYLKLAEEAGFKIGITVHSGNIVDLNNLMEVPRVRVHNSTSLEKFARLVER
ncbi:MAG: polysaccharide deacetylase family protein, partial [Patescibacteria group bacterium]|nr:polysaccharide deacetylase family protein [Patescibacteria group bacterium]